MLRILWRVTRGHEPPWYTWLERQLAPVQGLVVLLLVAVAAISLFIAWKGANWLRTTWLVYLISP